MEVVDVAFYILIFIGFILQDFTSSVATIRPSVSPESLVQYQRWAEQFGVNK